MGQREVVEKFSKSNRQTNGRELDMGQFFKPNPTQNLCTQPNPWKLLPDLSQSIIDTRPFKKTI